MINKVPVDVGDFLPRSLFKFRDTPNHPHLLAIRRLPHRNRRPPVPVSRNAPVVRVLQPVVEPLLLYVRRDPPGFLVVLHQLVLNFLNLDEERSDGFVNQRRVRPPAEGIGVHDGSVVHQSAAVFDRLNQVLVRGLDVLASIRRRDRGLEAPVDINRVGQ